MDITFKVEGMRELNLALNEIEAEIGDKKLNSKILVPAVREAMKPVLSMARNLVPVDTGGLQLSLQIEARRPTKKDRRSKYVTDTDTVIAVVTTASGKKLKRMSEGTGLVRARKKLAKLTNANVAAKFTGVDSDARSIAQEFGSAHNGAHPYLRPAIESQQSQVINTLKDILARRISQFNTR